VLLAVPTIETPVIEVTMVSATTDGLSVGNLSNAADGEVGVISPGRPVGVLAKFFEATRLTVVCPPLEPPLCSVADSIGKIVTVIGRSVPRPFNEMGIMIAVAWIAKDKKKNSASFIRAHYWPLEN
jgi:hypothetical protein